MRAKTLLLPLIALLAPQASADTILLVDGKSIEKVTVVEETLQHVAYREGSRRETVPSEQVLRIRFEAMPPLVERADLAAREGQLVDAVQDLEMYISGVASGGARRERHEWAPAYAAFRLVELQRMIGDMPKAVAAAEGLIQAHPGSRYVPYAYLAKAEAQAALGEPKRAAKTLDDLEALVAKDSLSARWRLEAQLAKVLLDPELAGPQKRDALIRISSEAGREFPTVRNKADVGEAEVLLATRQAEDAEKIFRRVIEDPRADGSTLAAAYNGLGDVLYQRAATKAGEEAKQLFREALLTYMRVVVNHGDQSTQVPKALFFAGRAFDQIGEEEARENSRKLYLAIVRQYPGSRWASEARGFLR